MKKNQINELLTNKIIDEKTANNIKNYYNNKEKKLGSNFLIIFGIIMVCIGIFYLFRFYWDDLNNSSRIIVAITLYLISLIIFAVGKIKYKYNKLILEITCLVYSLFTICSVTIITEALDMDNKYFVRLIISMLLILPIVYIGRSVLSNIIYIILGVSFFTKIVYSYTNTLSYYQDNVMKIFNNESIDIIFAFIVINLTMLFSISYFKKVNNLSFDIRRLLLEVALVVMLHVTIYDILFILYNELYISILYMFYMAWLVVCLFKSEIFKIYRLRVFNILIKFSIVFLSVTLLFVLDNVSYSLIEIEKIYNMDINLLSCIGILLLISAFIINIYYIIKKKKDMFIYTLPFLIILFPYTLLSYISINLYIVLYSIYIINKGEKLYELKSINAGVLLMIILMVHWLNKYNITFLQKSIIMIIVGIGIILLNVRLNKRYNKKIKN